MAPCGIHRDVYLVATPQTYIADHYITSKLDDTYQAGSMSVELTIDNALAKKTTKQIEVELLDPNNLRVASKQVAVAMNAADLTRKITVNLDNLKDLKAWSPESPSLYTVIVRQLNGNAEEMVFSTRYGFREVERRGNLIYVNGKREYFKGVNTQDIHPLYGHAIDVPTMLKDVVLMKQANVNTVRTSHYPRQPKMYAMFDYYGLYCMDEADIECHGYQKISNIPSWRNAYVDRISRMCCATATIRALCSGRLATRQVADATLMLRTIVSRSCCLDAMLLYTTKAASKARTILTLAQVCIAR